MKLKLRFCYCNLPYSVVATSCCRLDYLNLFTTLPQLQAKSFMTVVISSLLTEARQSCVFSVFWGAQSVTVKGPQPWSAQGITISLQSAVCAVRALCAVCIVRGK